MGPRPFSHGNLTSSSASLLTLSSFNGAATFQSRKHVTARIVSGIHWLQWGRDLSVTETWKNATARARTRRSFNGAATFQSRKLRWSRAALVGVEELQWGRDLSVTETYRKSAISMPFTRLLQWGRDLSVTET